jgi:hypothetical protein
MAHLGYVPLMVALIVLLGTDLGLGAHFMPGSRPGLPP